MSRTVEIPETCFSCGKKTRGVCINEKPICRDCWIKFNLTEKLGIDPIKDIGAWDEPEESA